MKIGSYFDYYDWTLDKQLQLFKSNELDYFILRKVEGLSFTSYLDKLDEIEAQLKKVKVGFFDPLFDQIDFDNEDDINNLKLAVKFSKRIKTKNLVILIKPFTNDNKLDEIKIYLKKILKITKRLNIFIKIDNENDMFIFHKIANEIKFKKVKLIYNPATIYIKNNSPISSYSLMSRKMGLFEVADINEDKENILVGYGIIDIKQLFKNLYLDRYKGLITLNSNLDTVFKNFGINSEDVKKKEKRENLTKYLETIQKLGYVSYDKKNEVSFEDIINHQIKLLKIVFK